MFAGSSILKLTGDTCDMTLYGPCHKGDNLRERLCLKMDRSMPSNDSRTYVPIWIASPSRLRSLAYFVIRSFASCARSMMSLCTDFIIFNRFVNFAGTGSFGSFSPKELTKSIGNAGCWPRSTSAGLRPPNLSNRDVFHANSKLGIVDTQLD